jgi:hypothetical protein
MKAIEARVQEFLFTHLIVSSSLEVVQYLNRFLAGIKSDPLKKLVAAAEGAFLNALEKTTIRDLIGTVPRAS